MKREQFKIVGIRMWVAWLVFALLIPAASARAADEYVVVANPANNQLKMDMNRLQAIFLGEITAWPDGGQIKLVALREGVAHNEFLKDVLKMTPMKFAIHWKRKVFTGTGAGTDIKFVGGDEEVKAYIEAHRDAVGYISPKSLDERVARVKVNE